MPLKTASFWVLARGELKNGSPGNWREGYRRNRPTAILAHPVAGRDRRRRGICSRAHFAEEIYLENAGAGPATRVATGNPDCDGQREPAPGHHAAANFKQCAADARNSRSEPLPKRN